jgi:hypothetical protein
MTIQNIEEYLNLLLNDTEVINISYMNLIYIHDLLKFIKLKILCCYNNQLTNLPKLSKNINSFILLL